MPEGWLRETLHFDRPVSPLFSTTILPALSVGFRRALAANGAPNPRFEARAFDHHVYTRWSDEATPAPEAPAEEPPELGEQAARWETEHLPELAALHAEMRALARLGSPPARVAADLARLQDILARQYELYYRVVMATQAGWSQLEAFLRDAGDPAPGLRVAMLVSPTDSLLRDVDARLAALAAESAARPGVPPERLPSYAPLWDLVADRPHRIDLASPTWREDPTPLQRALRQGDAARAAFDEGTKRALARRQDAERDALARLGAHLEAPLARVLAMLRKARGLAQTHNYLVGEIAVGLTRQAYLRAGARLAHEGRLEAAYDIIFLERDEALAALRGETLPERLVASRRRAFAEAHEREPPETLGDVPAAWQENAQLAMLLGFRAKPRAGEAGALRGLGASPGRAEGPARVLRDEADVEKVEPGDVLVVLNLAPTWTPAMLKAAAIVTETGGLLCHAAIVAREMGKPAVVGVPGALARLPAGARVRVDGDAGEVSLTE